VYKKDASPQIERFEEAKSEVADKNEEKNEVQQSTEQRKSKELTSSVDESSKPTSDTTTTTTTTDSTSPSGTVKKKSLNRRHIKGTLSSSADLVGHLLTTLKKDERKVCSPNNSPNNSLIFLLQGDTNGRSD